MEKKIGIMFLVFALLLLQLSELQGAPLVLHDEAGNNNNNWARIGQEDKGPEMTQEFSHLMGEEEKCEESDGECVKRRMITEAHLDYIYTQSHGKP